MAETGAMAKASEARVPTPAGAVRLTAEEGRITRVRFETGGDGPLADAGGARDAAVLREAAAQLRAWVAGERAGFDLPLAQPGTPFQREVWAALAAIPPGETRTYGAIAAALGRPGAARAVGAACGRNRLAVLVPCHRAVGADGSLTGFAWGVERKRWLLEHERGATTR
ncbi:MAG: methylated-DNA--[protein]-cysteine S-methyltransferase [Anaeromyxobacteraceae bacterium]